MHTKLLSATLGLALLTACNANLAIQATGKAAVDKVAKPKAPIEEPSTSASANPSPLPSASASPHVVVAPSTAPVEVQNPFGVPSSVRLPLPASVIATGGGNLIGQAGGNLIGQAGGNVIATGGGNVIATGGGNYMLLQSGSQPPRPRLSVSIPDNLNIYMSSTAIADTLLKLTGKLVPGRPVTLSRAGQTYTYLLELKADHAVLSIGKGQTAQGPDQLIGISYSSPHKGRLVLRDKSYLLGADVTLATDFDLEKGSGTADAFAIGPDGSRTDCHWELMTAADAATGKAFVIRSAVAQSDSNNVNAFTAHFLKDGSAAGATALADEVSKGQLMLMPNDGLLGANDASKPYDLYMGPDGKDIEAEAANAALKALVPTLDDFVNPLPPIPTADSHRDDMRYAFPD